MCWYFQNRKLLAEAKEEYEHHNDIVMKDMPRLYEGRLEYFRPSFQALIKSQVRAKREGYIVLKGEFYVFAGKINNVIHINHNGWFIQLVGGLKWLCDRI